MRLTVSKASLLTLLSRVGGGVAKSDTMPVLGHRLLSATADGLTVTATDLDIEAQAFLAADVTDLVVTTPGDVTAPTGTLSEIVRRLPDGGKLELQRDIQSGRQVVRAGRYRAILPALDPLDFPRWRRDVAQVTFSLRADVLADLIGRTRFAASRDETKAYLGGIYLHVADGPSGRVLRSVATDGHRFAQVNAPLPDGAAAMPGVIVPSKTLTLLAKLLSDKGTEASTPIVLAVSPVQIVVRLPGLAVSSKLVDGTYPDYARVIPPLDMTTASMTVDRELLAAVIDRIGAVSDDQSRVVRLTLADGTLTITSASSAVGTGSETIDSVASGAVEVGVNGKYARDVLAAMGGDTVTLAFIDASSPIRTTTPTDDSGIFVVMPRRV